MSKPIRLQGNLWITWGPLPLIPNDPLGPLPLIPNACIDTRPECFTFATASNCDYRGGLANRYDYRGIYGLRGLHGLHCCRTCTDRYGGGRLGPFGQLPLIPNVCNDDVAGCAQDADKCHSYSTDWTSYMATHCKRTCGYCH